jgi:hypothetical protein
MNMSVERQRIGMKVIRAYFRLLRHSPEDELCHPVPGGYKYRDLALQVGGVSNETVKYGREFCGTSTQE